MAAPFVGEKGESTQKYNHVIELTSLELPAARYHNPVLSWIDIRYHHRNNVSQKWDGGHKLAISMRPLGMKTLPLDIFSGILFLLHQSFGTPVGTGREYNIHHVLLLNLFVIYAMTNVNEVIRCENGNWLTSSMIFILSVTFSVSVFEAYIANTQECITSIGAMGWNVQQWDSLTVYHYQC